MMLDELRRKPKSVRDRYAFIAALLITGIVALVWFLSLGVSGINSPETNSPSKYEDKGFMSSFVGVFGQAFDRVVSVISKDTPEESISTSTEEKMKPSSIDKIISDSFEDLNERQNGRKTVKISTSSTPE